MSNRTLDRLLGTNDWDPGCEAAFEVLDRYVEAIRRGAPPAREYSAFLTHLRNCAACREDTEGLLSALALLDQPPAR
jgi:hypothetical protein